MKLEKKIKFELEKISSWFQTGKKNPVHHTQYFKLENWKNPVQIDRGITLIVCQVASATILFDLVRCTTISPTTKIAHELKFQSYFEIG